VFPLPPGVNPIAVDKYINIKATETYRHRAGDIAGEMQFSLDGFFESSDRREYSASAFKDYTQFVCNLKM